MTEPKWPRIPGYEPVRFLGWGNGMLYLAREKDRNGLVVLKVFPRETGGDFVAKASRLSRWRHPGVLGVVGVGEVGRLCYVAFEYLEPSETLDRRLSSGPLPVPLALATARAIAALVADARAEGLVCTGLGLCSIVLTDADVVRLCAWDFDISESLRGPFVFRSLPFTPPELIVGELAEVTPACDVYEVGVALYAMLAGRLPFDGDSLPRVLENVLHGSPVPVRTIAPHIPENVEAVCMKCLARDPSERYPSLADLMRAVSLLIAHEAP